MTHRSRLSPKHQTTVPRAVREALGLAPGDELAWEVTGGTARLRRAETAETPEDELLRLRAENRRLRCDVALGDLERACDVALGDLERAMAEVGIDLTAVLRVLVSPLQVRFGAASENERQCPRCGRRWVAPEQHPQGTGCPLERTLTLLDERDARGDATCPPEAS
jgi:bifunctional DNA-binding transcriptional regulator/antitoxin component of YhaV-PrlF toxin-antitoxin module